MLKQGLLIDTTFYPPQFSLDSIFNIAPCTATVMKLPHRLAMQCIYHAVYLPWRMAHCDCHIMGTVIHLSLSWARDVPVNCAMPVISIECNIALLAVLAGTMSFQKTLTHACHIDFTVNVPVQYYCTLRSKMWDSCAQSSVLL